jgi:2-polyprenyl-3-methyl-5-hydroxy-6-metoxy-1,4-benzoquinol methylase
MALDTDSFKYWAPVDRRAPNNAHAFSLQLIGRDKHVLELGCAAGHVTTALVDQGCTVVGLEYDEYAAQAAREIAEDVVITNLFEPASLTKAVDGRDFDVLYAGDVLEHLPDPAGVLIEGRKALRPGGSVVISLPNVAHVDVKLALLAGRFDYRDYGLLDRTHLRFFTKDSILQMLDDAGLAVVELRRVLRPPFETELEVAHESVGPEVLKAAMTDPEAQTYQFVVKAVPVDGSTEQELAVRRYKDLDDQLAEERAKRTVLELEQLRLKEWAEMLEERLVTAEAAERELQAVFQTKTFRATAGLRKIYRKFLSP